MRREAPACVRVGIIGHVDHGKTTLTTALSALARLGAVVLEPSTAPNVVDLLPEKRLVEPVQVFTLDDGRRSKSDRKRNPKWRNR